MADINFVTRVQNINTDFANLKKKYALVLIGILIDSIF